MHDQRLCAVCRREPRGFGWFDAIYRVSDPRRDRSTRELCSMRCQDICHRRRGMIDPTPNEIAAMRAGGQAAGEYLESIGKTDLAVLTEAEWLTLLEVVITAYQDELARQLDQGRHPAPPLAAGGRP